MHDDNGKRELESLLRSLGYNESDFQVRSLGGDIASTDRIELEILEETFDGPYNDIHQALTQSNNARQVVERLAARGFARRSADDG